MTTDISAEERQAEHLSEFIETNAYKKTMGAWIDTEMDNSLARMSKAFEDNNSLGAATHNGAYVALRNLKGLATRVFARAAEQELRRAKKVERELNIKNGEI